MPSVPPFSTSSSFEQRLASARMPPPGPEYFQARRQLWWAPGANPVQSNEPTTSRRRLEELLSQEDAHESEQVWSAGVGKVWKGLTSGMLLRSHLPLSIVIKVLLSGWIRDGTWPRGGFAPEPDDELPPLDAQHLSPSMPSTTTSDPMSGIPSLSSPGDIDTHLDRSRGQVRGRSTDP